MVRGLVLGKFLPYHSGHAHLIRTARRAVDELTVLVCSLERESIPGRVRFHWVRESHPDCRVVHVAEEVPQSPDESPDFWPIWCDLIQRHAGAIDVVFTSEQYGDELAARIGASHTCVDLARAAVPISGTRILSAPLAHWEYLPSVVRPYFTQRVAILGPESTGKTTLAATLAARYRSTWVPEFGREYCETRPAMSLTLDDFERIGRGQLQYEDEGVRHADRLLFCDTDLLTTCTWSDIVVGSRPDWLDRAAAQQSYAVTLVLSPEGVPWVDDGVRVLERRRTEHMERIVRELDRIGRSYVILSGSFEDRLAAAGSHVDCLLDEQGCTEPATTSWRGPRQQWGGDA
jgi:NadR type nicotinamide-nucleotide adenylyltransferase